MNGAAEMGVRGWICERVSIVGPGAPGWVRLPWAYEDIGFRTANARNAGKDIFFIALPIADAGSNPLKNLLPSYIHN
jgi:hypothetical protein